VVVKYMDNNRSSHHAKPGFFVIAK